MWNGDNHTDRTHIVKKTGVIMRALLSILYDSDRGNTKIERNERNKIILLESTPKIRWPLTIRILIPPTRETRWSFEIEK